MAPTLFEIFGHPVPTYEVFIALAAIAGIGLGPRWMQRMEGLDVHQARLALIGVGVFTFVGGRVHFVLNNWTLFDLRPLTALNPLVGGLHAAGAITGLVLGTLFLVRHLGIPVAKFADALTPTVGIGIAIARLGCFFQGCCFGKVCNLPWGVAFPKEAFVYRYHIIEGVLTEEAARSAHVHPLQIYFALAGLLLTAVAFLWYPRKRYDGHVALVVLFTYAISAAALEFVRADYFPRIYWGPLPQLEWIALMLTVASGCALIYARLHFASSSTVDSVGNQET